MATLGFTGTLGDAWKYTIELPDSSTTISIDGGCIKDMGEYVIVFAQRYPMDAETKANIMHDFGDKIHFEACGISDAIGLHKTRKLYAHLGFAIYNTPLDQCENIVFPPEEIEWSEMDNNSDMDKIYILVMADIIIRAQNME